MNKTQKGALQTLLKKLVPSFKSYTIHDVRESGYYPDITIVSGFVFTEEGYYLDFTLPVTTAP